MPKKRIPDSLRRMAEKAAQEFEVVFTEHALERMWARRILPHNAAETARRPDTMGASDLGPKHVRAQKVFVRSAGGVVRSETIYVAFCASAGELIIETVGWRHWGGEV